MLGFTCSLVFVLGPFLCPGPLWTPVSCPGKGSRQMLDLWEAACCHLEEILMVKVSQLVRAIHHLKDRVFYLSKSGGFESKTTTSAVLQVQTAARFI